MPAAVFERQMDYLEDHGYRTISLEQLSAFLEYREAIPRKSVIITIDDGYSSVYDVAYPILREHGFTATLFIYTDFVGVSSSALSWEQLAEMKAAGFEVGSHTLSHSDLSKQAEGEDEQAYRARVAGELRRSKEIIDRKLGQDTRFLAYPYGRFNTSVVKLTKESGYTLALSVKRGSNPFFADPFVLKRDQILKRDMTWFVSRLNCFQEVSLSQQ
jgi:peptidoglycan/xylan/chitin deacetylase (PgdA/CDA1 family)